MLHLNIIMLLIVLPRFTASDYRFWYFHLFLLFVNFVCSPIKLKHFLPDTKQQNIDQYVVYN